MSSERMKAIQIWKYSIQYPQAEAVEAVEEEDLHSVERIRWRVTWLFLVFQAATKQPKEEMTSVCVANANKEEGEE